MEVSKKFVLEAHKAACSDCKAKIEAEFPELFPKNMDSKLGVKIKALPAYNHFAHFYGNDPDIRVTPDRICIGLPTANKDWTFAAWKLAMEICNRLGFYPVQGRYVYDTDTFDDGDKTQVIVLEK